MFHIFLGSGIIFFVIFLFCMSVYQMLYDRCIESYVTVVVLLIACIFLGLTGYYIFITKDLL